MFGLDRLFKLKRSSTCIGMHIMDKQVKLIEATMSSRGVDIHQLQTISLPEGTIRNGKIIDEESVVSRLGEAARQYGLAGASVNLTVPTANVVLRKSVFPSLKDKELRNMIDVELHSGSQIPFKNPVFDYIRLGAPQNEAAATAEKGKGSKNQEEVLIFATPIDMVESYSNVVFQAGMVPQAVELSSLALFRLLAANRKLTGLTVSDSFMIVHAEADYADFSIFAEGIPVFMRSHSMNSGFILETGTEANEAYGRNLSMELGRVLNYYKYSVSLQQQDVKQMFLVGDHELTATLAEQLRNSFDGEIINLPLESVLRSQDTRYKSYAVPIGLAMKGA
ncbi:type IV pilus biogenesis protein PilM [Gorillibacterium sp. sgz5001074]|uniref:type IV pilus biogenesis protein PilM n=1 Tax=Gorillibacterium sp. sgz5001074 TaxID=3446695 RepID=UPI003F661E58